MTEALGLHRRSPTELQAVLAAQRNGSAFLEYRDGDDIQQIVQLGTERERLSIGRLAGCEVAVPWDSEVSRVHALLEQAGGAWTVEDRGSRNGTLVNAARINGPHVLRDGDVVRVGRTQLVFHAAGDDDLRRTAPAVDRLTPRPTDSQRKVLVELCRPALERGGGAASNREIAEALFVSVETVKTHMRALFDAFEVGHVPQYHKRSELVRRALETGLVSVHDLEPRN
ncbi:MAG TPA: FHA domain-containing protein [Solirubrobacteraceae bacterium]|nr:FHA domain-containing protein [Solirubrobacteraceae bacterium]